MRFFSKRQDQRPSGYALPPDIVARLTQYAHAEVIRESSMETQGQLLVDLSPFSRAEPDRFLADVAAAVRPGDDWAAYGASCVAWELLSSQQSQNPTYQAILDGGIAFLRANGVPPMRVKGYEWQRWIESGGDNTTWLQRRPIPSETEAPITPLRPGEVRKVIQILPDPNSNLLLVRQTDDGRYCVLIDARQSDEDLRRTQSEWKSGESLYDLYIAIGLNMQTPTYWYDKEVEPYFPLPRPRI